MLKVSCGDCGVVVPAPLKLGYRMAQFQVFAVLIATFLVFVMVS